MSHIAVTRHGIEEEHLRHLMPWAKEVVMSRKQVVVCPGSGQATSIVHSTSNPKVNCPRCQKRVGVMHSGKIRKHTALTKVK
jgi:uncharacterized paraquat-inducible protein A